MRFLVVFELISKIGFEKKSESKKKKGSYLPIFRPAASSSRGIFVEETGAIASGDRSFELPMSATWRATKQNKTLC